MFFKKKKEEVYENNAANPSDEEEKTNDETVKDADKVTVEEPEDKTVNDHYFISGIEMELENMMSKFDYKIKYARYKDKYFFSNDENVAQLQANKEIRREYAEKIDELGYDRKEYGIEEEM